MSKFTIDTARGFDVITKAGKVGEHFDTYEAATAYARARRMPVRDWAVGAGEKGGYSPFFLLGLCSSLG